MSFSKFYLTEKGINLLAKAQSGTGLIYTKAEAGDGTLPQGQSEESLTALIHKTADLQVFGLSFTEPGNALVKIRFSNEALTESFMWREVGLFARDPEEGEILYAYANAGDLADRIPSFSESPSEFLFQMITKTENAENVTVEVGESMIYVTKNELDTVAFSGSYQDLKEQPTAADTLQALKTVDGPGSGLDADTLDGRQSTEFALAGHTHLNVSTAASGFMSSSDKSKLDGIASGAQVNPNAFSIIQAGGYTLSPSSKSDTLKFTAGPNIILSGNSATKEVTIGTTGLKTVATTGSYHDLLNRPASMPANGGNADTVGGLNASALRHQSGNFTHNDIINVQGSSGISIPLEFNASFGTLILKSGFSEDENNRAGCIVYFNRNAENSICDQIHYKGSDMFCGAEKLSGMIFGKGTILEYVYIGEIYTGNSIPALCISFKNIGSVSSQVIVEKGLWQVFG